VLDEPGDGTGGQAQGLTRHACQRGTGEVEGLDGTVQRQLGAISSANRQCAGSDHGGDGVEAVESARRRADDIPFVVVHVVGGNGQIGVGAESAKHRYARTRRRDNQIRW